MKDVLVQKSMSFIVKNTDFTNEKYEIINYGLQGLYSTVIKLLVTIIIALVLDVSYELLLFLFFYSILRTFAGGFHADTNLQCWLITLPTFIIISLIIKYLILTKSFIIFLFLSFSILLITFSPADTKKKPQIRKNIRNRNKIIVLIICIIYFIILFFIKNNTTINSLLFAIIWQSICVNPLFYILFNQPYNNYKKYDK